MRDKLVVLGATAGRLFAERGPDVALCSVAVSSRAPGDCARAAESAGAVRCGAVGLDDRCLSERAGAAAPAGDSCRPGRCARSMAAGVRAARVRGCAGARMCAQRGRWRRGDDLARTAVGLTAAGEGRGCARVSRETWTEDRASGFPGAVFCSGARLSASGWAGTRTSGGSVTSAFGYPEVTPLPVWEVAVTPVARRHRRRGRRRTDQP
jgi:hypothetical protein